MDTKVFWIAAISIAVGGLFWQMGGFADLFAGSSPGEQIQSSDELNQSSQDAAIDGNFTGDASSSDGNLVGLIISGVGMIFNSLKLVLFLPGELIALGLPEWTRQPLRALSATFVSLGFVQLAAGRVYR